ncbi:CPCC family cysteine-rich protein [Niallia taxi]|uniref:CPCC family cysteine-rich protein n=1 Tax=Niallia taxi TaxID=2499688 RepID=UPI0031761318
MKNVDLHTCPCCGYKTLEDRREWSTCQVCIWNDDEIQADKPDFKGGPNKGVSLREAQKNFKEIGVCSIYMLERKKPSASLRYKKDSNFKPLEQY